jgi:hypothetical protein
MIWISEMLNSIQLIFCHKLKIIGRTRFLFSLKEGMITPVIFVTKSLLHVQNSMSICTSTKVHGSDVMNVGGGLCARMHFVLIREFTQASDLISVLSAVSLSTPHQTFVFMSRYIHMYLLANG